MDVLYLKIYQIFIWICLIIWVIAISLKFINSLRFENVVASFSTLFWMLLHFVHANILVFFCQCINAWINDRKWSEKLWKKNKRPAPFIMPVVYCILFICLKWIRKRINSNIHNILYMWMKYIYYSVNATRSRSHLSIANSGSESDLHRMVPSSFCFYSNSFGLSSANAINKMQGHDHSSIKFRFKRLQNWRFLLVKSNGKVINVVLNH